MSKALDARLTDADRENKIVADKLRHKKQSQLNRDLNTTFGTGAGTQVLKYIKSLAGYQQPNIVVDPNTGEVFPKSLLYNEARRAMYLTLRKTLSRDILIAVEIDEPKDDGLDLFE